MTSIYVRSTDGNNTDTGLTWALAKATLAGGVAGSSAGDIVNLSQAHAETLGAAISVAFPNSLVSPLTVACVSDSTQPPTSVDTTATISTTGAFGITLNGSASVYGVTFQAASAASAGSIVFGGSGTPRPSQQYEMCNFILRGSGTTATVGIAGDINVVPLIRWKNCGVKFASSAQSINFIGATFVWDGGSVLAGTVSPTALFTSTLVAASDVRITGIDMSNCSSSMDIFSGTSSTVLGIIRNSRLPNAWTGSLYSAVPTSSRSRYEMHNCDSGNTTYRVWVKDFSGELREDTAVKRTGGASDGTTQFSWKVTGTVNCNPIAGKFLTPEIAKWNDVVGSPITVTVDILHDSLTNLKDDEIWLEVQYMGTTGYPISSFVSDSKADVLATPSDQTTSASTWATGSIVNPNKQKLSVTFTPQQKGFLQAKIVLAKASYTVYVDPKLQVT